MMMNEFVIASPVLRSLLPKDGEAISHEMNRRDILTLLMSYEIASPSRLRREWSRNDGMIQQDLLRSN
ncbi:MAG: hypothetical protein Q8O16_07490, partial [Dehalococcoidia bacterium]|nr:hypothetical protein [Dehalococcoidia bacterium]